MSRFYFNVIIKGTLLFVLANLLFAWVDPLAGLGRISAYNWLIPGRQRLPYADHPEKAYSLSLYNLEAMFASHEVAATPKPKDEFRVILLGDSSTWGFLLPNEHTLSGFMNAELASLPDGRKIQVYNLGYPVMSLAKDLLILSYAMHYQPDLIVWLVTLESFPYDKQLYPPLLQNNPARMAQLIQAYDLRLDPADPLFVRSSFWDRTIVGSRRPLADLIRLQLYGPLWAATGIDQVIPETYIPRQEDFEQDESFHDLQPPLLIESDLALDILRAGILMAQPVPVLIVNEPIFISQGKNSEIRYNFFYPRWAYDRYRQIMADYSARQRWRYKDFWDAVPGQDFTNSAVHLSAAGSRQMAKLLLQAVLDVASESQDK